MFLCVKLGKQYRMDEIGRGTINIAEWSALLWALYLAREADLSTVELIGDSQLAVNQARGTWKVRHPTLRIFKEEFDTLSKQFTHLRVLYQPRLQNAAATYLEDVLLACATIGPNEEIAAQFPSHIDWPTYADVRSSIDISSGNRRRRFCDQPLPVVDRARYVSRV